MDLSLLLLLPKNIPPRVEINSTRVINFTRIFSSLKITLGTYLIMQCAMNAQKV